MLHKISLLFCFYLSFHTFSQNSFPSLDDNPKWYVHGTFNAFGGVYESISYEFEKDTLLCGETYAKVSIDNAITCTNTEVNFVRKANEKVFFRSNSDCGSSEKLLYDFGLNIGDSMEGVYGYTAAKLKVDTIELIDFSGVLRKKFTLHFTHIPNNLLPGEYYTTYWVEGIGALEHPFYASICLSSACESLQKLTCMDSSSIRIYHDSFYPNCGLATIDENSLEFQKDFVFPNPNFGEFNLKTKESTQVLSIAFVDIMGKEVIELDKNQTQFDFSNLAKGTYLLLVVTNLGSFCSKIVLE